MKKNTLLIIRKALVLIFVFTLFVFEGCKKKDEPVVEPEPAPAPQPPSPLASVSTLTVSGITDSSAVISGTVFSEGTSAVTAVGICWDTVPAPTTLKSHVKVGAG